ncbi:MAG: aminoacetone oxidase family FAD-binding enzyme [Clostridiales bacterium]|nr:aminoacetone oxidase family FAD-binding enzyme [Clostridiales bacterium]
MHLNLAIIGGGAAGMSAAISAKRKNPSLSVAVIEKMPRVGKKLLATGNGRCNITNTGFQSAQYHSPGYAQGILFRFGYKQMHKFLFSLGLLLHVDEEDRVYPHSGTANSVVDAFRFSCEKEGIKLITGTPVTSVLKKDGRFVINGGDFTSEYLIIAAGGCASPVHGSDGSGFEIAKSLGHSVTRLYPALVPMLSDDKELKALKGVRLTDAVLTLKGTKYKRSGEIQFGDGTVSGIVAMELAAAAAALLDKGKKVTLSVDLLSWLPGGEKENYLRRVRKMRCALTPDDLLTGVFPKPLGIAVLKKAGVYSPSMKNAELSDSDIAKIVAVLTGFELNITGVKSFEHAQVTRGGVKTQELEAFTLRSKITENLYFAGETVDVDGYCGGFNLSWAIASGFIAGELG